MTLKTRPPRILFLGMHGAFSIPPLHALLEGGCRPLALITPPPPGTRKPFRRLRFPPTDRRQEADRSIFELAARHAIPIYEIGELQDRRALRLLSELKPDFIVAACFPRLLPKAWLETPRLGCINLHPSLLPAYRGPAPLEEQLENQETHTGITLHYMDEGADTGDIIAQESIPIPEGSTLEELNRLTAQAGARLLLEALRRPEDIPRRPQV